jgi:hypothetical protein
MPGTAPKPATILDDVRLIGGNVNGSYALSNRSGIQAFACRAQSISPRNIALSAPVSGAVGETVALHFDDFGLLKGRIARHIEFGFILDILAADEDRARIAATIRWLKKRVTQSAPDQRRHKRLLPRSPRSSLVLADGLRMDCFIIDMSPAGVAISADYTPRIGQALAVGRAVGRVIRHLELGFVVQFVELQPPEHLERVLERLD